MSSSTGHISGYINGGAPLSVSNTLSYGFTSCTGSTGTGNWNWAGLSGKKIELEIGKAYRILQHHYEMKPGAEYIKVFAPVKQPKTSRGAVRIKYWDEEYGEWDSNCLINTEQPVESFEEVPKLSALVLFGDRCG